ncbi:MAG: MAPEG family protein [Rhodobacteraceae bacterium]|nr:MAPEG family protein [Paracoccaceae bacterium]
MILTATPLYAGLLALLFVALSARVIVQRRRAHVSVGDGNDQSLRQKMRVHANFAEYTPIGLVLLGLTELQGAPYWVVHLLGLMLLTGRLAHAAGMGASPQRLSFRVTGMVLTLAMITLAGLANVFHALI